MRSVMIFIGGALTGSAITFGALALINKRRNKDILDELEYEDLDETWEEVKVEAKNNDKEEDTVKEDIQELIKDYNNKIEEYAKDHKEQPVFVLEPWIMDDEEWTESPYDKAYYTYYGPECLLVDENMQIVADGRCGTEFADICESAGVVHVCNEELATNYEITYYDEHTYSEDLDTYDEGLE